MDHAVDAEFDRLMDSVTAANEAVRDHTRKYFVVWRGAGPPPYTPEPLTRAAAAEYHRLATVRNDAQAALDAFMRRLMPLG